MISSSYNNVQYGGADYLHRAKKYGGSDKIIEFIDQQTQRKIEFYSDSSMEKSLQKKFGTDYVEDANRVKATGKFEKYLNDMWSYLTNEENTKDLNNDGYINVKEMANSKRNIDINIDIVSKEINIELFSFLDTTTDEKKAITKVEEYFTKRGFLNNMVTVDQDFNGLLKVDSNFNADIEDMEILANMPPEALKNHEGLSIEEKNMLYSMLEEWKKKRKEQHGEVDNIQNINHFAFQNNLINKLLDTKGDMASLTKYEKKLLSLDKENKEIFSKEKLIEMKGKLVLSQKYIDTQADNAKIFSLKI